MLKLTLIRHAKSSWDDPALRDFDRPLNKRGLRDAPRMGKVLRKLGAELDLILTSPAKRATTTANLLAEALDYADNVIIQVKALYDASLDDLLGIIHTLDSNKQHIAVIAHNPGLTTLTHYLCSDHSVSLPTCGIASIEFNLDDWQTVHRDSGRLVYYEYPKKYSS